MKKTIMICDRCRTEYSTKEIPEFGYKLIEDLGDCDDDIDLCPMCTEKLERWFKGIPKMACAED